MGTVQQSETRYYNRLIAELDGVYHEIAVRQGFSDSAMAILYTLADNDGACLLRDVIRFSGLNKQTANSALRRLEREDLIVLEPAGGRAKRVKLTARGEQTVHATVDRVIDAEKRIYDSWSREEWELYVHLTERYLRQLREEMKEITRDENSAL